VGHQSPSRALGAPSHLQSSGSRTSRYGDVLIAAKSTRSATGHPLVRASRAHGLLRELLRQQRLQLLLRWRQLLLKAA